MSSSFISASPRFTDFEKEKLGPEETIAMILVPSGSSDSDILFLHFIKFLDSVEAVGIIIHKGVPWKKLAFGCISIVSINKNHKLTVVL